LQRRDRAADRKENENKDEVVHGMAIGERERRGKESAEFVYIGSWVQGCQMLSNQKS
jgi:hypothetical protein